MVKVSNYKSGEIHKLNGQYVYKGETDSEPFPTVADLVRSLQDESNNQVQQASSGSDGDNPPSKTKKKPRKKASKQTS